MRKKMKDLKPVIIAGLSQCLVAYAMIISMAPCSGEWYQPKTPEALHR